MKAISKWYEWVLFLPAVLPLFYIEGVMYPLMAPKTLALRAFGIIALALFAYLAANGRPFHWHRLRRWETWVPAALLAVAYGASIFGTDFFHSFWSTFERGDGLLTLTVSMGYFYLILISVDASWLGKLFRTVAWVGSASAAYLVLQWLTIAQVINLPFIVQSNGRIGGTLGNAAFLSAYLGMAFFMTVAAAREYGGRVRIILYAGAALELFAIMLAATRGTILALAVVGVVALVYAAWKGRGKVRTYAGGALASLLVLFGFFLTFRTALQEAPFEPVRRIASISVNDPTVSSRLFIWSNVSREAMTRPLLGYGAEHVDIPFDRVYDPTAIAEEWFDRTHNAYLDYLVQFGILGAALYLALIAVFIRIGWVLWKKGDPYALPLLGMAAIYGMQNFFVFDTAVTLWLLLSTIAVSLAYAIPGDAKPAVVRRPLAGLAAGLAFFALIIPAAVQPLRANLLAFEAYLYQIADVPRANAATEKGLALNTYADLEFGYNAYFMYTDEQVNRLEGNDLRAAYENARAVLARNLARYSYDARTAVYLAQVLSLAPEGVAPDGALLSEALTRALEESPKRAQPWFILANLSISEANNHPVGSKDRGEGYAAAKDILRRYNELVPRLATTHFVLAQLAYASGDLSEAAEEASLGRQYYTGDEETARRAVKYYGALGDLVNLEFFLSEIVGMAPTDYASAYDLAKVKFFQGDKSGARALVNQLRAVAPSIIDSDPAFSAAIAEYERTVR